MAKVRYVGDVAREVVCNGHPKGGHLGTVEPDQILEVDDDVYAAHGWPESLWVEVEGPGEAKKTTSKSRKDGE